MDFVHSEEVEIAKERAKALRALQSFRSMGPEVLLNSGFDFMVVERLEFRRNSLAKLRASITHQDIKSALLATDRAIFSQLAIELKKTKQTPPKEAPEIHGLKRVSLIEEQSNISNKKEEEKEDVLICSVCHEGFKAGEDIREIMGCKHSYHYDCISKWMKRKPSCPMCRYEIPKECINNNNTKRRRRL